MLIWSKRMRHQKALDHQSDWASFVTKFQRVVGQYASLALTMPFSHQNPPTLEHCTTFTTQNTTYYLGVEIKPK